MRLGLHRMTGSQDALFREYVAAVRPPWVKMLDEWPEDLVGWCHAHGSKVIGRVYFNDDEQRFSNAAAAITRVRQAAREHPWVDAWELWNECHQTADEAAEYARVSVEFASAMRDMGKIAVLGCFSVGQTSFDYWTAYHPALLYIARSVRSAMLGLHEYGGDDLFHGREGQLGWWILRYRRHRLAWNQLGLGEIPVLITESGKDNILPDGKGGFRDRPGEYAVEMADYCRELSKDAYIKGVVDFGWATADPAWETFDASNNPDLVRRLMTLMTMLPIGPGAVPQEPATMPPIQKVTPRVFSSRAGYRPRYVVLHSAAGGPGLTAHSLALYLSKNSAGASAHYSVGAGEIFAIVDEGDAAHHAGGSTLPDGTRGTYKNGNSWVDAVNAVSIGVEMVQVAGQPTPNEVVSTAHLLVADICRRHGIPASRVVGHREISGPGGHVDPVGVDMPAFRRAVDAALGGAPIAPVVGVSEILKADARKRAILSVNPAAALYKAITAAGMVPVSAEFDAEPRLVAQVADGPRGRHLFYVTVGDWSNVKQTKL